MLKVAMISKWHVHAEGYARSFNKEADACVTCVWDENPERGREWAAQLEVPFVEKYDEVLARTDVDAVAICSPTNMHADLMIRAARAHKHIFTEKVMCLTTEECRRVAKTIEENGVVFTISFPHRCFPENLFIKQAIDEGMLGDITLFRVRNCHNGALANWLPDYWYDPETTGGGAMMDLGAHPMYTLYWLLGEPKTITSTFTEVTHRGVEDNAVSVIEFANGAIGVSETGFVSECNPYTLEISGTDGAMMIHGESAQWGGKATGGKWGDLELPEKIQLPVDQWVDAVTNGTPSPFTIDEAVMLTRLMDGAYKSFESGTKFTF